MVLLIRMSNKVRRELKIGEVSKLAKIRLGGKELIPLILYQQLAKV